MSLKERLNAAKKGLKETDTKVTHADGTEYMETRINGVLNIVKSNLHRPSAGYIKDLEPDLQVAQVTPFIFLGSQDVAADMSILIKHKISDIVNVATGIDDFFPEKFNYLKIELLDCPTANVLEILPHCFTFIDNCKQNNAKFLGRVLVHCNAGVSRSVSVVLAYLIKYNRLSFGEAMTKIRTLRPCAKPNPGFERQLKKFELDLKINS